MEWLSPDWLWPLGLMVIHEWADIRYVRTSTRTGSVWCSSNAPCASRYGSSIATDDIGKIRQRTTSEGYYYLRRQGSRLFDRLEWTHHKNQTTKKSEAVTNKMALSLINYFVWENDVGHVLLLFSFQHAASCFSPLASYWSADRVYRKLVVPS